MKDVKQGPLYDIIFQSSSQQFQSIYCDQTPIETSILPVIGNFKRSNPIRQLIFQNFGIYISFVTSLSPNWVKRAQSYISCIKGDRKIKINILWNFKVRSLFLRSLSQNIAVLTPVVLSLTQSWIKKGPNLFHVPMVIER